MTIQHAAELACLFFSLGCLGVSLPRRRRPMARRCKHRGTLPPPSAACRRDYHEFVGR